MAYKTALESLCRVDYCGTKAKWEVFNRRNGSVGKFCTRHANEAVRELQALEKAEDEKRHDVRS